MHNFQSLFCQSLYVHTILRFARGSVPLPLGKFCICKLFTHNFRPFFSLNLQKYIISGGPLWPPEIYNFWWSQAWQGAAVLFIRECVFLGNHKCTISVPFLSKCLRMWLQGGGAPLPKKIILQAKIRIIFQALFGLNLQKYIISGGCEGAALHFIREYVFRGNHKCTISVPLLTHNFRPFLV